MKLGATTTPTTGFNPNLIQLRGYLLEDEGHKIKCFNPNLIQLRGKNLARMKHSSPCFNPNLIQLRVVAGVIYAWNKLFQSQPNPIARLAPYEAIIRAFMFQSQPNPIASGHPWTVHSGLPEFQSQPNPIARRVIFHKSLKV